MRTHFAFGKAGLDLELPSGFEYRVLEARSAKALPDERAALEAAIDSPVAGPSLVQLAQNKYSAAISVCDITRPAPNRRVLPRLLNRLERAGITRDKVTVCIATGLHREATEAEIAEILGPEIYGTVRVINHNARNLQEHRHLGTTSTGTPVYIDDRFMSADLHITLGFI